MYFCPFYSIFLLDLNSLQILAEFLENNKKSLFYLECVQELVRDLDDLFEVSEEDSDVDGPLFQDLRGVQSKGVPGQLQVAAEFPLRCDQLADHILALFLVLFSVMSKKNKIQINILFLNLQ